MVFTIYGHDGHLEFRIMTHFSSILYNYHINAKYEISLKLAQQFHRKFCMNGCYGNQSCHAIFLKTSYIYIYINQNIVFHIPMKKSLSSSKDSFI